MGITVILVGDMHTENKNVKGQIKAVFCEYIFLSDFLSGRRIL